MLHYCLIHMETDLEKGRLNKTCLAIIWLADCVQLASLPSGKKNNRRKKKTASQKVAYWNIRTIQDSEDRHQRRSAFVVRELSQLDIDIAAVSEARFAEQSFLAKNGAGYTLIWPEKNEDERRLSGVGCMIKTSVVKKLQNLPASYCDRLMSLRLPIRDKKKVCHCPHCVRTNSAGWN